MSCIHNSLTAKKGDKDNLSELSSDLLSNFSTQEEADLWFAHVQTPEFIEKFGDWKNNAKVALENREISPDRVYEKTLEPKLFRNEEGLLYFKMANGEKQFLKRKILDEPHEFREGIVSSILFDLFYDNIEENLDTFDNINVEETFKPGGYAHDLMDGNTADIRDLKQLVKERLASMKIKLVEREEVSDNDEVIATEDAESARALDLRSSAEKNSKDNATANIKFLMSFVPEMEYEIQEGEKIFKAKTKTIKDKSGNEMEFLQFHQFDSLWKKLEQTLANVTDFYNGGEVMSLFDKMVQKLGETYQDDATIKYLTNKLESLPEYKKNEFVQAFYKNKIVYYTTIVNQTGDSISYRFFKSESSTDPSKGITNTWNSQFKKSPLVKYVNGKFEFNTKLALDQARAFNKILTSVAEAVGKNKEFSGDVEARVLKGLENIGITITPEALSSYISSYSKEGDTSSMTMLTALDQLSFLFDNLAKLNTNSITSKDGDVMAVLTASSLAEAGKTVKDVRNSVSKQVKELAKKEAEFRKDLSENTIMGAEGKKYWAYSMPSYVYNKLERLKGDMQSEMPTSAFYENSKWLKKFREGDTKFINQFSIGTFSNLRLENQADEGTDNKDITQSDQAIDLINKTLLGVKTGEVSAVATLMPADKATLHQIIGIELITNTLQGQNLQNEEVVLSDEVVDTFVDYFIDELTRAEEEFIKIKTAKAREEYKSELKNHYHFKLNKAGEPMFFAYKEGDKEVLTNKTAIKGKVVYPVGNAFKSVLFADMFNAENLAGLYDLKKFKRLENNDTIRQDSDIRQQINAAILTQIIENKVELANLKVIQDNQLQSIDKGVQQYYSEQSNFIDNESISDLMIADFVINNMISNIEYAKMFTGDYAYYKDMSDFSKRVPATYTDGLHLNLMAGDNPNFNVATLPPIYMSSKSLTELEAVSPALAKAYGNINATDGQGWITLDRWKFIMERTNHWGPKMEEAYQRFQQGNPTADDYKMAAQPVKGVHFEVTNGVPTYIKYSAAVLVPSVIKGTGLENLYKSMTQDAKGNTLPYNEQVHEAIVVDGIKVGAGIPNDVLDANKQIKPGSTLSSFQLRNHNYKVQQDLRPKGVKQTLIGSQLKKTILTNLKLDQDYSGLTGQEVFNNMMEVLSDLSEKGLKDLMAETGIDENGNINDKEKFTRKIIDNLKENGNISNNLIEALSKEYDYDNIANYRGKIQNAVMSMINNATVKIKSNGGSFIQMSSWAFDEVDVKNTGITLLVDGFKGLKGPRVVNGKVLPGQIFISASFINKHIPNWKQLAELGKLKEVLDERLLKMIGYRIPNQGMSSNDHLEVAGILPESYGDTIVPYVDITTKTGSDFDIDKMYVIVPNAKAVYSKLDRNNVLSELMTFGEAALIDMIKENSTVSNAYLKSLVIDKKKALRNLAEEILNESYFSQAKLKYKPVIERLEYIPYDTNKSASEQSKKAVENRFIELIQNILTSEVSYSDQVRPLDSKELQEDIEFLHGAENTNPNLEFFSPMYQLQKKFDNSGGKSGVGLTANHLVDHMWTQVKDISFQYDIGLGNSIQGRSSFAGEYDITGKTKISETLSWFLTAYVDIAKDPYVSKGNHNTFTANTVFMMVRAGVPLKYINRLVGQPIIKEMANIDIQRKAKFPKPDFRSLNEAAIENIATKYSIDKELIEGDPIEEGREFLDKMKTLPDNEKAAELEKMYAGYENSIKFEKSLKANPRIINDLKKARWLGSQIKYQTIFNEMREVGESFSDTILGSKQDVNTSKDFMAIFVDRNRKEEASKKGFINFNAKFDNTFLGTSYKNSTELGIKIMKNLFITSNDSAQVIYNSIANLINPNNTVLLDPVLGNKLERSYFASILGQTAFKLPKTMISDMFQSENSIYDRLLEIRQILPDNYFLTKLDVDIYKGNKFVRMDSTRNNSPEAMNELSRGWLELFESDNEVVRQFAQDLIYYSFYTSGFMNNIGSFFDHIPNTQLNDLVKVAVADSKLALSTESSLTTNFIDNFFKQNWRDNSIVPKGSGKFITQKIGKEVLKGVYIENATRKGTESNKYLRPYLKSENSETGKTTLLKNVGFIRNDSGKIVSAIFVPTNKIGFSEKGFNFVEYNLRPIDFSILEENNITKHQINNLKENAVKLEGLFLSGAIERYSDHRNDIISKQSKVIRDYGRNKGQDLTNGINNNDITPDDKC